MMAFDAYKILDEQEAGSLIDLIAPCMDDYLYIIDLKNDTLRISQSAVERFMLPDKFMNDATKHLRTLVYEKDRKLLENHKRKIYDGKEKKEYSWSKSHFYFIDKPCKKRNPGYPLDSMSIMPECNKYFVDLTEEDRNRDNYKDDDVINFIVNNL